MTSEPESAVRKSECAAPRHPTDSRLPNSDSSDSKRYDDAVAFITGVCLVVFISLIAAIIMAVWWLCSSML